MRRFMMMVMALAALGAMVATAQAKNKSVSRTARAADAVSTCTGLKSACLGSVGKSRAIKPWGCVFLGGSTPAPEAYCENLCNYTAQPNAVKS
jgi:hypothetical protein